MIRNKLFRFFDSIIKYFVLVYHTLWRDLRGYWYLISLKFDIAEAILKNLTTDSYLERHASRNPSKIALIFEEKSYSFRDVHHFTNQIANVFTKNGFKPGDNVALFMPSKPEHAMIWYGLSKIGVVTALINENLRSESLIHCIKCVHPKAVIFDSEFENEIYSSLEKDIQLEYFVFGSQESGTERKINSIDLQNKMNDETGDRLISNHKNKMNDALLYIFTSGTTGYPKALVALCSFPPKFVRFDRHEIVYNCLPMYHAMGLGTTLMSLIFGHTVVIRRKFSASQFWEDCIKHDCT
ncbi:long-chain fatty acid transport protein 4-like protein, partial [Leptotrombidium deliense]